MKPDKIELIPNQQTPRVAKVTVKILDYIEKHRMNLELLFRYVITYPVTDEVICIGMAANQMLINGKRFMARAFTLKNLDDDTWSIIVNPIVKEYIGIKEFKSELCLTWRGQKVIAERFRFVRVVYFDINGNKFDKIFKGLEGQIWQHEIDHINGKPESVVALSYPDPPLKKIGRNEECPCGSRKKYKFCCLD